MQNQFNNSTPRPQPQVPPRANNYPNPLLQNQNIWNNTAQNVRPPPISTNGNQVNANARSPAMPNSRSPAMPNSRSPAVPNARSPPLSSSRSPQLNGNPPNSGNVRSSPPNNNARSPPLTGNVRPPPSTGNVRPPLSTGNVRPPPPTGNGQTFNNRPPINNVRTPPVPQRTNVSAVQNQIQQFPTKSPNLAASGAPPSVPQRGVTGTPQFQPRNQPPPPVRNNTATSHNSNVQVNTPQNIQKRSQSQKELPPPPQPPKKSGSTIGRSASSIKTKFVGLVNRSISRKFSTNRREKRKRLSSYGGMNVHSAYRNSLMEKPVFDSKLLLKPQNPNFIISLGIVFMIASVSLAIAFIALRNGGLTESNIHDISNEDSFGFIFFSMFMIIIGLTGYVAYHKKWTSLLITYSVFLIFGFIVQIIVICLFLNIYFHPLIQMRYKWIDVLSDAEKQTIQEGYQCCGYLSVVDHGLTTSMCMPDNGATTLSIKSSKSMMNSLGYLDPSVLNKLNKRQDAAGAVGAGDAAGANGDNSTAGANVQDMKEYYKTREADSYTEDDIKDEGCARIIVSAIKSGLLQYILIEVLMAVLFVISFYFAIMHFKEQLAIEKEVDSARATFG